MKFSACQLSYAQVCTRLLFRSFGRHWYKVEICVMHGSDRVAPPLPGCSSVILKGTERSRRLLQDGEIMSCLAPNARAASETSGL